jgi:hypothetical protein
MTSILLIRLEAGRVSATLEFLAGGMHWQEVPCPDGRSARSANSKM